jgi:hypothetical protein
MLVTNDYLAGLASLGAWHCQNRATVTPVGQRFSQAVTDRPVDLHDDPVLAPPALAGCAGVPEGGFRDTDVLVRSAA